MKCMCYEFNKKKDNTEVTCKINDILNKTWDTNFLNKDFLRQLAEENR